MPSLLPDRYYETQVSEIIKCGECWEKDLGLTAIDVYTGDEAVYEHELVLLPEEDAYQCDDCLKQSPNYDDED